MSFLPLTDAETILKVYHRHWFAYIGDVVSALILLVAPLLLVIAYFLLPAQVKTAIEPLLGGADFTHLTLTISAMWLLIAWIFAWRRWTDLYLDAIVITNERIYEIRQRGFFTRETTSFPINRIQDVTVKTEGFLSTMFGYGDLELETAGEHHDLDMHMMADPDDIKLYINTAHDMSHSGGAE